MTLGGEIPPSARDIEALAGQRIAQRRAEAGLTQQHVATIVSRILGRGWHQTSISKIEAGTRMVRLDELAALAHALGTSIYDLLGGDALRSAPASAAAIREVHRMQCHLRTRMAHLLDGEEVGP